MATEAGRLALDAEQQAVEGVVERLCRRFPSVPVDRVKFEVDAVRATFKDARIRDFVPILVEQEARDHLAHTQR